MGSDLEYPDAAGYPDGKGFLDEGTADDSPSELAIELDEPSTELEDDVVILSEESAFRALFAGQEVATMHIAREDGRVILRSTVVDASVRGRGLATAFIADVLDDLEGTGMQIVVECPEVARFLELHPEYARLRD